MKHFERQAQKGFTLIELLIVVAVSGMIAAIMIPNLKDGLQKTSDAMTLQAVSLSQDRGADVEGVQVPIGYHLLAQLADTRRTVVGTSMQALPTEHPWVTAAAIRAFLARDPGDTAGRVPDVARES